MAQRGGKRPGAGRKPGSRDRATKQAGATLSALARGHTSVALGTLAKIAKAGESESARVSAANALLDRGYGRPSQAIEHQFDLTNLSDEELEALERIRARLTQP